MNKIDLTIKFFLVICIVGMPALLFAQPGFDPTVCDTCVPFDGGVSLLVAAGIGYGLKKVYGQKKQNSLEV